MAVYRGAAHLAEAMSSVLQQDFIDWELLLVNDCSPDNSVDVIKTFLPQQFSDAEITDLARTEIAAAGAASGPAGAPPAKKS